MYKLCFKTITKLTKELLYYYFFETCIKVNKTCIIIT